MSLVASSSRRAIQHAPRIPLSRCQTCTRSTFSTSSGVGDAAQPSGSLKVSKSVAKNLIVSSAPSGTTLKNISVLKDVPDPIAKDDHEYPDWLWTVLTTETKAELAEMEQLRDQVSGKIDLNAERKRLKAINILKIKADNFLKTT